MSATFNMLVNQKHHSTIGSMTTEKMSKITVQYQPENISTCATMTLIITEKSLSKNNLFIYYSFFKVDLRITLQ